MAVNNLTKQQIDFIQDNKGKMKQKEIAACLGVTPACICKRLKESKLVDGYFNLEDFKKQYIA
jgi:predicted transcriptional regulator